MKTINFDTVTESASIELNLLSDAFEEDDIVRILTSDKCYDYIAVKSDVDGCTRCSLNNRNRGSFLSIICSYCLKSKMIRFRLINQGHRYRTFNNVISIPRFKDVYCNQDTCPYYESDCTSPIGMNRNEYCLLNKLLGYGSK